MQKSKGKLRLLPVETIAETEANFSVTAAQLHCAQSRIQSRRHNCTVLSHGTTMGRSSTQSRHHNGKVIVPICERVKDLLELSVR